MGIRRHGEFVRRAACVFVLASGAARASSDSQVLVAYAEAGATAPRYRIWDGSAWSAEGSASSVGAEPQWLLARNCPARNEHALATLDADGDLNIQFFNGSTWSAATELCTDLGSSGARPFDLAYDRYSGLLLIIYYNSAAQAYCYRTYNGTAISPETQVPDPWPTPMRWLRLVPRAGSAEIAVLLLPTCGCLYLSIWDGATLGALNTLNQSVAVSDSQLMDAAYESQSGDLVAVYAVSGSNNPKYRVWSGGCLGAEANVPSIGGVAKWIRLEADPSSDAILFAAADQNNDLNVNRWSGSAWGTNSELETSLSRNDRRAFDLAYEFSGTRALLVYSESGSTAMRSRLWDGAAWSAEGSTGDIGTTADFVQLAAGPGAAEIFCIAQDAHADVEAQRWDGSTLGPNAQVESNTGSSPSAERMTVSIPVSSLLIPANVPYSHDFETAMGAEWAPRTRTTNTTYTTFAGRHRTTPLKLALNTTIGQTYSVSFDFYAIDSWDGSDLVSGYVYGPDSFLVADEGGAIFQYTFNHEWPSDGATYPYPYDSMGNYGFNGGWKDAIYRKVETVFVAKTAVTTLSFYATLKDENNYGFDDESWGIDNISVKVPRFIDVSSAAGFGVTSSTSVDMEGGGIHWADLDNDGDLDAILGGGDAKRMINNSAGVSFTASSLGSLCRSGALLDIDNDGDIDFWAFAAPDYQAAKVYLNNGAGSLSSGTNLGFSNPSNNEGGAAVDVNADGWCDLVMFSQNGNWIGLHNGQSSPTLVGTSSSGYGLHTQSNYGNGDYVSSGDVNNDGRPDFFYHYSSGKLFVSNGDGTYTRNNHSISVTTGELDKFGSAWGDFDNDGDLDLFCARIDDSRTGFLWRNDRNWSAATGAFTNVASSCGMINRTNDYTPSLPGTRSAAWGDVDNDGDLDLLIVGGNGNNYLYTNQGSGTLARAAEGVTLTGKFIDGCFVDYDNDGDLDIALTRENDTAILLQNQTNNSNYLKVRLIGRGAGSCNRAGVGTRVELWNADDSTRLARRDAGSARGYGGTEPLWLHFGGVTPTATYTLRVYWSGATSPTRRTVVPASAATVIGGRTVPQMITVKQELRVTKWREVSN